MKRTPYFEHLKKILETPSSKMIIIEKPQSLGKTEGKIVPKFIISSNK